MRWKSGATRVVAHWAASGTWSLAGGMWLFPGRAIRNLTIPPRLGDDGRILRGGPPARSERRAAGSRRLGTDRCPRGSGRGPGTELGQGQAHAVDPRQVGLLDAR